MVSWKQFCFSDGEAIRQEGGAGRNGGTAKSARRSGRPPAGNPYGSGEFGPNPSASDLAVPPVRPRRRPRPPGPASGRPEGRPRPEFPPAERFHLTMKGSKTHHGWQAKCRNVAAARATFCVPSLSRPPDHGRSDGMRHGCSGESVRIRNVGWPGELDYRAFSLVQASKLASG